MTVSRHGSERLRKRIGLPKRVVERQAALAATEGQPQAAFRGRFRKYLDWMGAEYQTSPIVYKGQIYIFGGNKLITVLHVPSRFREASMKCRHEAV